MLLRSALIGLGLLCGGCGGGLLVQFGDLQPLPSAGELLNPESPMEIEILGYRRSCSTEGDASRVTLLPDAAALRAWQSANNLAFLGAEVPEQAYALIELGARAGGGEGFAVSRAAGRRGDTAFLKITTLLSAASSSSEAPSAPCALVSLPAGPWARVRVIDQVHGIQFTSPALGE